MLKKAHKISGVILAISLGTTYMNSTGGTNLLPALTAVAGSCIGAILPDIDNSESALGKKLWILRPFQKTFHHRDSIFHTLTLPVLLFGIICFRNMLPFQMQDYIISFIMSLSIGYILHLVLDTFTSEGIRWFFPFSKKRISLRHKNTGSSFESLCAIFLSLLYSGIVFYFL